MLSYPSPSNTTLFLPTSAALLAVYFIPVPGGPLRVKCQRPSSNQTRNEYEMIQRSLWEREESGVQTVQAPLSPNGGRLSQAELGQSDMREERREDTQYGYLKLQKKEASINQDIEKRLVFLQTHPIRDLGACRGHQHQQTK